MHNFSVYGFETFMLQSRDVYNFIGINFGGIIVFHFPVIMIFFFFKK